jgi:hypothetical protein
MSTEWFGAELGAGELEVVAEWAKRLELEVIRDYPIKTGWPDSITQLLPLVVLMPPAHPRRIDCALGYPGLAESAERFRVAEVQTYGQMVEQGWESMRNHPPEVLYFSQTLALPLAPVSGLMGLGDRK